MTTKGTSEATAKEQTLQEKGLLETEFSGNEHWRMLKSHSKES